MTHITRLTVLVFACHFVLLGCGSGDDNPGQAGETATIQGTVTNDAGFSKLAQVRGPVDAATVTVAQIQADGSLQTVSTAEAETDVNGNYTVEADVDGADGLIVVAQKGNVTWKTVVSSKAERGQTTRSQPHNDESTTEAELREEHERKQTSDDVPYSDEGAFISAEVAAEVKGDGVAIAELATAMEAEAAAHIQALGDAAIGATTAQIQNAEDAKAQAQIELETSLNIAAGNQVAIDAALETHHQAIVDAYIDAGIPARAYAKARTVSAKRAEKSSGNLNADARFRLQQSAKAFTSWSIDRACQSEFTASGASNAELTALANAGVTLRADIDAATTGNQIEAALEAYHDAVINELQSAVSTHATAITTMDATIHATGGAKLTLESAVSATATTQALIDAYVNFFNAVRTLVESTLATASQSEVELITEVMILANLSV